MADCRICDHLTEAVPAAFGQYYDLPLRFQTARVRSCCAFGMELDAAFTKRGEAIAGIRDHKHNHVTTAAGRPRATEGRDRLSDAISNLNNRGQSE
jgi:hypothetical protein